MDTVDQILPNHVFYVLQRLMLQRSVEASPLRAATQKQMCCQSNNREHLGSSQADQQVTHLEKVELVVIEDAIVVQVGHFKDPSQGFNTKRLHLTAKATWEKRIFRTQSLHPNASKFPLILHLFSLDSRVDLWDEGQPSEHSRTTQRCSLGSLLNTKNIKKKEEIHVLLYFRIQQRNVNSFWPCENASTAFKAALSRCQTEH